MPSVLPLRATHEPSLQATLQPAQDRSLSGHPFQVLPFSSAHQRYHRLTLFQPPHRLVPASLTTDLMMPLSAGVPFLAFWARVCAILATPLPQPFSLEKIIHHFIMIKFLSATITTFLLLIVQAHKPDAHFASDHLCPQPALQARNYWSFCLSL